MKSNFKNLFILSLFALFCFTACQNEVIEETENQEETIAPNSAVANLMTAAVSNDGSQDDIMDNADCFSINLPVTIVVNDITITINTLEDLALIEAIFNEFNDDEDFIEYLFPITIILNDYTQIVIENIGELEEFIEECINDEEEVIECVDFVYPISFSIYNSDFQLIDTVEIGSDEALYEFLENLDDSPNGAVIASLNYPVSLVYADGTTVVVENNQELEAAINAAEEDCDDDNEENDCDIEHVSMYLQECHWNIVSYSGSDDFIAYDIYFNENGTLEITNANINDIIDGNWELSETDAGLILTLSELTALDQNLAGNWLIVECDDDRFALVKETDNGNVVEMVIERDCEDDLDCSAQEINMFLQNCLWYGGSNLLNNDFNGPFHFTPNGVIFETPNGTVTGGWDIILTDEGIFLVLDLPEPYESISLEWEIVECEFDRLEMINGDNHLVLEKDCQDQFDCPDMQANIGDACSTPNGGEGFVNENCECEVENNNPFECFGNYSLAVCDDDVADGLTEFDLELIFANCTEDNVEYNFYTTIADAENGVNPLANPYTNTSNPQTIYSKVSLAGDPNVFEIYSHELIVEDCNQAGCSEQEVDAHLVECIWNVTNYNGSNDLEIFDFDFNLDGTVVITGDGQTITAMWSTSQGNDGVIVEFSQVNGGNIQAITGEWLVVECAEAEFVLHRNDDEMVMQQNCN